MSTAIAKAEHGNGIAPLSFTDEQQQMIRDTFASGATKEEFAIFMEVARLRRLNPILRQIHLVKRYNSQLGREVATPQTGIDGLRSIAERTGKYDGQDEPEFEYDNKKLILARVRVYRKDWGRAAVGVAHFNEYAQTKKDGSQTGMWASKPHIMLAKCAESLALRKAFPEDMGGLYTDEEMPNQDAEDKPRKKAEPAATVTVEAKSNGKPVPIWQTVVSMATDYGFDCGPANKKLWEFTQAVTPIPGKDWTEKEFIAIEKALAAKMVKPVPQSSQLLSEPESDIPF